MGLYLLVADDGRTSHYTSETVWEPKLPAYMTAGGVNVLWMAFVNPAKMPALPPGMQHIARNKPNGTLVIPSVGGEAYSASAGWPWLASTEAAEEMAKEVVGWKATYGIDGIDLDIEGNQPGATALAFARKCKELDPSFIVTQPVFGSPQIKEETYMVNQNYAKNATSAVEAIGIMVYEGTGSLQYVKGYVNGSSQWSGFPIKVDVPSTSVLLGAGGQASAGTIETLAKAAHAQDLAGIMVWYASVIDPKTGKPGNQYGGGAMDSSIQGAASKAAWTNALNIMHGQPARGYAEQEAAAVGDAREDTVATPPLPSMSSGHKAKSSAWLHKATSPDGPWTPVAAKNWSSVADQCGDPSPLQHPDGTWSLACNSWPNDIFLATAPHYSGPWSERRDIGGCATPVSGA